MGGFYWLRTADGYFVLSITESKSQNVTMSFASFSTKTIWQESPNQQVSYLYNSSKFGF